MDAQKSPARMANEAATATVAEQRRAFRECGVGARVRVLARLGEGRSWFEAWPKLRPWMLGDACRRREQAAAAGAADHRRWCGKLTRLCASERKLLTGAMCVCVLGHEHELGSGQ